MVYWDEETKGYYLSFNHELGVGPNAINLSPCALMWKPRASFLRKPESSLFKLFWTPAFAGVTV